MQSDNPYRPRSRRNPFKHRVQTVSEEPVKKKEDEVGAETVNSDQAANREGPTRTEVSPETTRREEVAQSAIPVCETRTIVPVAARDAWIAVVILILIFAAILWLSLSLTNSKWANAHLREQLQFYKKQEEQASLLRGYTVGCWSTNEIAVDIFRYLRRFGADPATPRNANVQICTIGDTVYVFIRDQYGNPLLKKRIKPKKDLYEALDRMIQDLHAAKKGKKQCFRAIEGAVRRPFSIYTTELTILHSGD